jgi:tripartite-type tricarboxylate transporter receptor subunit TctC
LGFFPLYALAWPDRPITLVVPFPPGGLIEQLARTIAPGLEQHLKTQVVIKNQAGGNHIVALSSTFNNVNDHTFVLADSGLASGGYWINPELVNQFKMINIIGSVPVVFSGGGSANLENFKHQTKQAKTINVASTGADSAQYMWLVGLENLPPMNPIYYKGGNPAMFDLAGGHVEYAVMSLTLTHQFAQTGKVTPLVISSKQRHRLMPNVPTYQEIGWKGGPGNYWYGFLTLNGTNAQAISKFNQALEKVLRDSSGIKKLEDTGMVFDLTTGDSAQVFFKDEIQKYQIIRSKLLSNQ